MPAVAMLHEEDPRQIVLDALGDISKCEVFHNQVLCAVYERPEKTKSGIFLTDTTREEDRHQGKVGLIVKMGRLAFKSDGKWQWPDDMGLGDWVYFRVSDGWNTTVNGKICRMLRDEDFKGRIQEPDQVW